MLLRYESCSSCSAINPISPFSPWVDSNPEIISRFALPWTNALQSALLVANQLAPLEVYYSSNSPGIGVCNKLLNLQLEKAWIMGRFDWATEDMIRVYSDTTITVTNDSRWIFAHLRTSAWCELPTHIGASDFNVCKRCLYKRRHFRKQRVWKSSLWAIAPSVLRNPMYLLSCDDYAHVTCGVSPMWNFLIWKSSCMHI